MNAMESIQDLTIFLVDDDESICRSLEFYFRREGVAFYSFGTDEETLQQNRILKADLVITDYSLPGMDGLQSIRGLNELEGTLLKILITAYGKLHMAVEAMRLGVHDFIRKPFNTDAIESAIQVLANRMSHRSDGILINGQALVESDNTQWRERFEALHAQCSCLASPLGSVIPSRGEPPPRTEGHREAAGERSECPRVQGDRENHVSHIPLTLCRETKKDSDVTDMAEVVCETVERFQTVRVPLCLHTASDDLPVERSANLSWQRPLWYGQATLPQRA